MLWRGGGGRKGGGGTGLEILIKEGFSGKGTFVQRPACCAVNQSHVSVFQAVAAMDRKALREDKLGGSQEHQRSGVGRVE